MKKTRNLVFLSLLIALNIILTRFGSIQTHIVRIGFGFLPLALASMMFGPILGGAAAAISDILGMMIYPSGAYFPGFTLTAFISGALYGIFLYEKPKSIPRIILSVLTVTIAADIILNTLWLNMITGKAIYVLLTTRLVSNSIMLPIKVIIISLVWKALYSFTKPIFLSR